METPVNIFNRKSHLGSEIFKYCSYCLGLRTDDNIALQALIQDDKLMNKINKALSITQRYLISKESEMGYRIRSELRYTCSYKDKLAYVYRDTTNSPRIRIEHIKTSGEPM